MATKQSIIKAAIFAVIVAGLINCNMFRKKEKAKETANIFFAGTYTNAESEGIYSFSMDSQGIIKLLGLAAKTTNPTYLAFSPDRRFLLAANEVKNADGSGTLESYRINGHQLKPVSKTSSGGAHPCFVAVNSAGEVLAANYSGGNVGFVKMDTSGKLSPLLALQQHEGKGTTERQQAPHAHSVWYEPQSKGIIAADLGTNHLWFSQIDPSNKQLLPRHPFKIEMAPGAGPRHLAFHPGNKWFYVLNELNNTITLIRNDDAGNYQIAASVSTLPEGFSGYNLGAHIVVSSDGRFVYASNRGHNSIAIFEVNQVDGSLEPTGFSETHGDWPRHFALSSNEDFLVVANQNSGNITSFRRNKATGQLAFVHQVNLSQAVCIVF